MAKSRLIREAEKGDREITKGRHKTLTQLRKKYRKKAR
jgi:hypothetical protein